MKTKISPSDMREWQANPITQKVRDGLEEQAQTAMVELLGACRMSTDPKVTAAVTVYGMLRGYIATIQEKYDDDTEPEEGPSGG